jgi:hypothetical protein
VKPCEDCGHPHNAAADRVACAALHGRVRAYPDDVRDPEAMCALCGVIAPFSSLLEHFRRQHNPSEAAKVLVRPIAELRTRHEL